MNVGGMVGHCAVRYWAMGQESLENKPASPDQIARMHDIVAEAIAGGALGFSTSRTILHRTPEGQPVPGTFADRDEMMGIARALGELKRGLFEAAPGIDSGRPEDIKREVDWMTEVSLATGRPVTFGLAQSRPHPTVFSSMLEQISASAARGAQIFAQSTTRGIGVLFGFVNRTPFDRAPSWRALRTLELEEKVAKAAEAEYRATMVQEALEDPPPIDFSQIFLLPQGEARYDHRADESLAAHAQRLGVSPAEAFITLSTERDGKAVFNYPFLNPTFDAVQTMLDHPRVVIGLGIPAPTSGKSWTRAYRPTSSSIGSKIGSISRWSKRFVSSLSIRHNCLAFSDRGVIRQGAYADLNVIDYDHLQLPPPVFVQDLPAGGSRYIQKSVGYKYTLVNGQVFMDGLEHSGVFAGQVLRSS